MSPNSIWMPVCCNVSPPLVDSAPEIEMVKVEGDYSAPGKDITFKVTIGEVRVG